jgi:esterase FrsA
MTLYLDELKKFVILHAVSQRTESIIYNEILKNITTENKSGPGSWVYEFTHYADSFFKDKQFRQAVQCYNLARFPYIDSPEKSYAHYKCLSAFVKSDNINTSSIEKRSFIHEGQRVSFYLQVSRNSHSPLLLVMGGIVSIKEQWGEFLLLAKKLDLTVAIMEMPGVGENHCQYHAESYSVFTNVINSLSGIADITQVYIIAMSFSGNMAIKAAHYDQRIKSIFTIGAPIFHFFRDKKWWDNIPTITQRTLQHITKLPPEDIFKSMHDFALNSDELKKINIPIFYVNSMHDEIIPKSEYQFLKFNYKQIHFYEFDDVHGSPNHLFQIKLLLLTFIIKHVKKKTIFTMILVCSIQILYLVNNFSLIVTRKVCQK